MACPSGTAIGSLGFRWCLPWSQPVGTVDTGGMVDIMMGACAPSGNSTRRRGVPVIIDDSDARRALAWLVCELKKAGFNQERETEKKSFQKP